jgi:hypothetical protein
MRGEYKALHDQGKIPNPPSSTYDPSDAAFHKSWHMYAMGRYASGNAALQWGGILPDGNSLAELRRYGRSMQDMSKYKSKPKTSAISESMQDISKEPPSIGSKLRSIFIGMLLGTNFEAVPVAINPEARKERELSMAKKKVVLNPKTQQLMANTGLSMPPDVNVTGLSSIEDVELLEKLGGERLIREMKAEICLASTWHESKWDTVVRYQLAGDIYDGAVLAAVPYLEPQSGKVKVRYVDPAAVIADTSSFPDGRDREYIGEIRWMKIKELRELTGMSEKELYLIAKKHRSLNTHYLAGNAGRFTDRNFRANYYNSFGSQVYDNFDIMVSSLWYICGLAENYIVGAHHRHGNPIKELVSKDAKLNNTDKKRGKEIVTEVSPKVFHSMWIVGTDTIIDPRMEYAMADGDGKGGLQLPLKLHMLDEKSPVARIKGELDDLTATILKIRNLLANLPPGPRMILDKSKLRDSIKMGGKTYRMSDLFGEYFNTGILVVESIGEFQTEYGQSSSNAKPFDFVPSGIIEDMNILFQEASRLIQSAKESIGITDAADGTARPDMLVGIAEGMQSATNNALRPFFNLYQGFLEDVADEVVKKWSVSLLNGDIDVVYSPIGSSMIKEGTITRDVSDYTFGIQIKVMPTSEDKVRTLSFLASKVQAKELDEASYFTAERMIQDGHYRQAQIFIAKAVKDNTKLNHARSMELAKAQSQGQGEYMLQQVQADIQKIKAKGQEDRLTAKLEGDIQKEIERIKLSIGGLTDVTKEGMKMGKDAAMQQ